MCGNKSKVQLEYGLRGDKVIFVSELTDLERGKACNCICPVCRKQLVAKLGSHNQWHFAHDGAECNLVAAQQTALHMLAKEIIESSKKLRFPGISIKKDDYCNDIEDYRVQAKIPQTIEYKKASVVNCDSVLLQKKISSIVPDIMVTAKGRSCLIEVAVTHFIDEEKERKIKEIGLPLFEIDLSNLYNSEFSREELAKEVLFNPSNRMWIFNPLYDYAERWAKDQYSKYIHSAEEEVKRQDA